MDALCIIPCGKRKIWDNHPNLGAIMAENAYIGTFHNLCMRYAKRHFDCWVTLSAKHGFLLPTDMVPGNYDLTFHPNHRSVVSVDTLKEQLKRKGLENYQHIVVLTGKKYQPIINQAFSYANKIEFPLLGTRGIGEMQKLLKDSLDNKQILHTEME